MIGASEIRRAIEVALRPLRRRVMLMVVRGLVELASDGTKLQTMQISLGSCPSDLTDADDGGALRDDVERFQPFGFSSVPSAGAMAIVINVAGNGDHPIAVAVDDPRYRPTGLSEGESCVYTKQDGKRVYCKADGSIEIGTSPTAFVALADKVLNELNKIATTLGTGSNGGGPVVFATTYTPPSDVAATQVKAK